MGIYKPFLLAGMFFWMFQSGLSAQSGDSIASNTLSGAWVMDADAQLQYASLSAHYSRNPLKEEHREGQLESMKSRMYVFYEDGQFESSWVARGGTQVLYGTWVLGKEGNIEIQLGDKSLLSYRFVQDKDKLQLSLLISGESDAPVLYLKRFEP